MQIQRAVSNKIAAVFGDDVVEEIDRWNEYHPDFLGETGVEMTREEEQAQALALEQLRCPSKYYPPGTRR